MIPPPPTSTAATCANCGAGRGGEVGLTGDGRRIKGEVVLRTQDSSGWGVCACREGGQETARAPSCWGYTSPAHAHGIRRARRPLLGKLWPVCWLHVSHLLPQRRFSLILRNSVRDWKHLCFRTATGLKQDGCSQPCQYGGGPFPSCWNCSARRGHDPEWREPGRTRTLRLLLTRGQRRGLTRPHKKGGPRKPSWAISS